MEFSMIFKVSCTLLLLSLTSTQPTQAQKATPTATPTPTPAPAPAPDDTVNLTALLTVAGPFHTFLGYLESTKVIDTFQNQANNSEQGITIFVPKDQAFSTLKTPSLSNLTGDQLKSLCLFHALPQFYTLADFKNVSDLNPVPTFARGQYSLNFTDDSGTVLITSGWTNTKISSSVHTTDPVAVYQVDRVLLPVAIFGTDIPPAAAPVLAPETNPPSGEAPASAVADGGIAPASSKKNGSNRVGVSTSWRFFALAVFSFLATSL